MNLFFLHSDPGGISEIPTHQIPHSLVDFFDKKMVKWEVSLITKSNSTELRPFEVLPEPFGYSKDSTQLVADPAKRKKMLNDVSMTRRIETLGNSDSLKDSNLHDNLYVLDDGQ